MNSYATDGKCHNSEPGAFYDECGKPAVWLGTKQSEGHIGLNIAPGPFSCGFCDDCKRNGHEARAYTTWQPYPGRSAP